MSSRFQKKKKQFNNKRKQDAPQRLDVLKALEEQRKHSQQATSIVTQQIKEIPGYFYDKDKKKYFSNRMKKDSVCVGIL